MTTYNEVNNAFNKAYHTHKTFRYANTGYVTRAALDLIEYQTKHDTCLSFNPKSGLRCAIEWVETHN